jgi:hypothetical protein
MHFETSVTGARFDIPDEWWSFAEMDTFKRVSEYYPPPRDKDFELVPLSDVEPPMRNLGVPPFKKYKLLPVLFTFWSPECALPPVEVSPVTGGRYHYRVCNGYHRYYASVAVGYTKLPIILRA